MAKEGLWKSSRVQREATFIRRGDFAPGEMDIAPASLPEDIKEDSERTGASRERASPIINNATGELVVRSGCAFIHARARARSNPLKADGYPGEKAARPR